MNLFKVYSIIVVTVLITIVVIYKCVYINIVIDEIFIRTNLTKVWCDRVGLFEFFS